MYLLRRRFRNRLRLRHRTRKLLVRVVVLLCLQLFLLTAALVLVFRWVEPPITAFMLQTQPQPGVVALEYQWVDRDDIAFDAFAAVLAAEDGLTPVDAAANMVDIDAAASRPALAGWHQQVSSRPSAQA